jgi:hypothetical protein
VSPLLLPDERSQILWIIRFSFLELQYHRLLTAVSLPKATTMSLHHSVPPACSLKHDPYTP